MGKFSILDSSGKKKNYNKLISIVVCLIIIIGSIIGGILFFKFKNKDDKEKYSSENAAEDENYQQILSIYESQGIDYSYEDYVNDQEILDDLASDTDADPSEMSDAYQTLYGGNSQTLYDIQEQTQVYTEVDDLIQSIISQTIDFNNFIDNHLGWPESGYGPEYDNVRAYIDAIINYAETGDSNFRNMYDVSLDNQVAQARYCISNQEPLHLGDNFTEYYDILNGYLKCGHPLIDSISSISLTEIDPIIYDEMFVCILRADFISNGKSYTAYLASQAFVDGRGYYKILDLVAN